MADKFSTITGADWAEAIRQARAEGAREGNVILQQIRAAVAALSPMNANQPAPVQTCHQPKRLR